jgi:hypothetical protein
MNERGLFKKPSEKRKIHASARRHPSPPNTIFAESSLSRRSEIDRKGRDFLTFLKLGRRLANWRWECAKRSRMLIAIEAF